MSRACVMIRASGERLFPAPRHAAGKVLLEFSSPAADFGPWVVAVSERRITIPAIIFADEASAPDADVERMFRSSGLNFQHQANQRLLIIRITADVGKYDQFGTLWKRVIDQARDRAAERASG